ncbi:MAG TPA: TolC family outer membrane protein [Xanthobacteraceae bacterium]|jgi:outer membrane protein|nr:TolC family outer membrane protein [Xanthobacteraceae bacterium]
MLAVLAPRIAGAETLPDALVRAYQGNPQLNAERAKLRSTDEGVPQALSGYRPQVTVGLSAGLISLRNLLPDNTSQSAQLKPWVAGITLNQTLFNGYKTGNTVRQAEAQIRSGRESLRAVEQSVLLDGATAYMGVLSNQSLVEAQRLNVTFLRETLETTRTRLRVGDVPPTDVAQAEARYARATADLNAAEVALAISRATYTQVIGVAPGQLVTAEPVDRLLPHGRDEAIALARRENPTIVGATYDVDAAQFAVSIAESGLFPTVGVQGNVSRNVQTDTTLGTTRTDQASIVGSLNMPLYDGGLAASQVRQAKETLTQNRVLLDRVRAQAETAAIAAWATHEGAKIGLAAAQAEVRASTIALEGVRKEALAGKRTTLEVLNSQQDLMQARARLIAAQQDRVVASYTLLSAIGHLDRAHLALSSPDYDPQTHYQQVRDVWHGLRTPSGQ